MGIKERKTRDRNKRIDEIEAAARIVFKNSGLQCATIEKISKLAEVSTGTIYFYFKTKEQLYVSLMIPMIKEFNNLLMKFRDDLKNRKYKDSESFIRGLMMLLIELNEREPDGSIIFQNFQLNSLYKLLSKDVKTLLNSLGKKNFNLMREIIEQAIEMGIIDRVNVYMMSDLIWGTFLGITQIQRAKKFQKKKNHLYETLTYASSLISSGIAKE